MTDAVEPAAHRAARTGPGAGVVLAFGLICGVIGAGVGLLAPRYLQPRPLAPPAAELPAEAPKPAAAVASAAPAAPPPIAPPAATPADLTQIDARIAALEARQARTSQAAASALAAAALVQATAQDRPFTAELAALRAAAPADPELAALAPLADAGAPTRAALAESFADYAARAASASRRPGDGAGIGQRIAYVLSRIVTLRRVGDTPGNSTDALLARAERLVEDGDLDAALRTLDRLTPDAREAIGPWRVRAERRAQIDRAAAALQARALQELTAAARGGP